MSTDMRAFRSLAALAGLVPEIVYVMCGARGETGKRLTRALPRVRFIGFEPDIAACEALRRAAPPSHIYYPAAVGRQEETRTLYVTREPACSSLLKPNPAFFGQFVDCGEQVKVVEQRPVEAVSLNQFLPGVGVTSVDFLELDTQGTELEILQGADRFLSAGVVGVKVEAEFSPIYEGQPLFGDVDQFLRGFGFMLFDLTRNRYRRVAMPRNLITRGQLLWGDAFYLRDYRRLTTAEPLLKLCLIAAALGFHDYAVEAMDLALREDRVAGSARETLFAVRNLYLAELQRKSMWLRASYFLQKLGFKAARRLSRSARTTAFSWFD